MKTLYCPHKYVIDKGIATIEVIRHNGKKYNFQIDIEDLTSVLAHKWCVSGREKNYFMANVKKKNVYLHHFLVGRAQRGMVVDHIDRNPFNNCRKNLRFVTLNTNSRNRKNKNKYRFPGIYYMPEEKRIPRMKVTIQNPWQVRLRVTKNNNTRLLHIGVFPTREIAIQARREAELRYYGYCFH